MNIIINQMDRCAEDGFVEVVHWTVTKTSGDHTASAYGTESFTPDPTAAGFKPYAQLTPADVTSWLTERWGTDGVAAKEAALDSQLADMASPKTVSGLPWAPAPIAA